MTWEEGGQGDDEDEEGDDEEEARERREMEEEEHEEREGRPDNLTLGAEGSLCVCVCVHVIIHWETSYQSLITAGLIMPSQTNVAKLLLGGHGRSR